MQRLLHSFPAIVFFLLFTVSSNPFYSQHNIPNLKDYTPTPRLFSPIGCRDVGHSETPHERVYQDNYDMSESISRSDTFDIEAFVIDLDLTKYTLQQLEARALITLSIVETGAESVWFDLVELTVDSLNVDGAPSSFEHENGRLIVPAPGGVFTAENNHEIEIYYSGHPMQDPYWGGVYFESGYIYQLGIGLTSIPPNYGKVWHPCFDNFVERATYTWNIRSAGGMKAHLQGTFLGEVLETGDTLTRSFTLEHPITTHCAAFAVANYTDSNFVHTGEYGEVPVRLTAKPEDINQMVNKFSEIGYAIDALEYWWGPYAWERVGYVLTTDGALEIPTNIAYPRFMIGESIAANGDLYSHELGHLWWGDLVAPSIHNHMWIKEGPAEYSSHLFIELKDGHEEFVELVKDNQQFVLEECHIQDDGFHPLSPMPDEHIYGRHTYYKGASIHHNLRAYLGDDLYRTACQNVISTHFDSHMDADLFRQTLEDVTDVDLDPFFDAQIYQPGFSTWLIDSTSTESLGTGIGWETTLYLNQKLRACSSFHENEPLDVTLWSSSWDTTVVSMRVGGEFDVATIYHPEPFILIGLNADGKLNQGRLDNTIFINETTGMSSIPGLEMRMGCDEISDSVIVRLEHHWAAPDSDPIAFYINEISSTHFWTVDATWPDELEGTDELVLDARFSYVGNSEEGLDFDLYNGDEANAFLAWRPNSASTWIQYPDYTWQSGSLVNGNGVFQVSTLRKGQYAFANGDISLSGDYLDLAKASAKAYPSPATTSTTLDFNLLELKGGEVVKVWNTNGGFMFSKSLSSASPITINIEGWSEGSYVAALFCNDGVVSSVRFVVAK
jgi:hypothetical protein